MIKIIGGLIICFSLSVLGLKKSVTLEQRLDVLNEFEKSLLLLKGEIKYSAASLPEAIESVSKRTSGYINNFYEAVYEDLSEKKELNIKQIWNNNVTAAFSGEFLESEDIALISELGGQLGHLDVDMQLRSIELCMNRLKERQRSASAEIKEKSRLFKTMGVAGGVLLTLVLL